MIFVVFLLVSIFFDSNVFSVPLVFIASLLLIRRSFVGHEKEKKKTLGYNTAHKAFGLHAFFPLITSLILLTALDAIRLERMGTSPFIYLIAVAIMIVYGRFFELSSSRFFAMLLTIMTFAYAYITRYDLFSTGIFLLILIVTKWILALIPHEKD